MFDKLVLAAASEDGAVPLFGATSSLATLGACGSSGANKSATDRGGAAAFDSDAADVELVVAFELDAIAKSAAAASTDAL